MSNVGRGAKGTVYTGKLNLPPSFLPIGTGSGLTAFGVLVAEGDGAFQVSNAGTTGQVLIANSGANPSFQSGGSVFATSYVSDSGTATPAAAILNVLGQKASTTQAMMTTASGNTVNVEDRTWQTRFVVDASATVGLRGTYTTIAAAVAAASADDIIFIRPGTYTENFSVGVALLFVADSSVFREGANSVTIAGTVTVSASSINVGFQGIRFNTNAAVSISLTGNASTVTCDNCYFSASNANSISCTGNSSTNLYLTSCSGVITDTFALLTTTNCICWIKDSFIIDISGTPAASTTSAGTILLYNSRFSFPITTSSTGVVLACDCVFGSTQTPYINRTFITTAGTGISFIQDCLVYSGTASAISAGAGTTLTITNTTVNSSNTNAVTGAGTIIYSGVVFTGTSSLMNTTTQTAAYTNLGKWKASGQPAFLATSTAAQANVTGDSTLYTMQWPTEIYDQDSNFDATSTFTAPVTGRYAFSGTICVSGWSAGTVNGEIQVVASNRTWHPESKSINPVLEANNFMYLPFACYMDMDAADTVTIAVTLGGGTKTADIVTNAGFNNFGGSLMC